MQNEPHDLIHELPEYRDAIHTLKTTDNHFSRLFDEYHEVNRAIHRIEQGVENTTDEYAETLKKQRLALKDELFSILQAKAA